MSNLVNFLQVILEFTLLKHAIFNAIRPRFDDDLHSSRWRFQTNWKIAILISALQLAITPVHPVAIWWDSFQWPRSLRHKKLYSQRSGEWPLLFASAFDNILADRKSTFKFFNCNNQSTSLPNLVNFSPTISEFLLLKRHNFCRNFPAIGRRSTFVMLAFPNGLERRNFDFSRAINDDFCTPCKNLGRFGQWPRRLRHKKLYSWHLKFFCGDFRYVQ